RIPASELKGAGSDVKLDELPPVSHAGSSKPAAQKPFKDLAEEQESRILETLKARRARKGLPPLADKQPASSKAAERIPGNVQDLAEKELDHAQPQRTESAGSLAVQLRGSASASSSDRRGLSPLLLRVLGRVAIRVGTKFDDPEEVQYGWKLVRAAHQRAAEEARQGRASSGPVVAVGLTSTGASQERNSPSMT